MKYPLSEKYNTPEFMAKIMGPNPLKLEEELLTGHMIPDGATVCDLGSGRRQIPEFHQNSAEKKNLSPPLQGVCTCALK